jgi:predicted nucleic acid-binding protein
VSEHTLAFFDTNVLLYCWSGDEHKALQAEALLADQGTVSVQVLNEFANVAARKFKMPWAEVRDILSGLRSILTVQPLTVDLHDQALALVEQVSLSFYDALIVAAALDAGCDVLYSEDLQHGRLIGGRLNICNPFLIDHSGS